MRALTALGLVLAGCAAIVEDESDTQGWDDDTEHVAGYGVFEAAISSSALRSANGVYGSGCVGGRANTAWSVVLSVGAPLDNTALSVTKLNTGCVLSLTSLRIGAGASGLYTAQSPIALSASYPTNATLFSSPSDTFLGNAKLSAVSFATSFNLSVLTSADPYVSSNSLTVQYTYEGYILAHDSPLSYWRLNEAAFAADDFTGTTSAQLQIPRSSLTWTKSANSSADAILTDAGRVRASGANKAVYGASATPSSADYAVSADIFVRSILTDDQAGVLARATAGSDTYYYAGYVLSTTFSLACLCQPKQWQLWRFNGNFGTQLDQYTATLTAGSSYKVFLQTRGTVIQVYIDGVLRMSAPGLDLAPITAVGTSGILVGASGGTASTNTTGLHLDNFLAQPSAAVDFKGSNTGTYYNAVALGDTGALTSPGDRAITWVGSGYIDVARTLSDDFSIEFWYKAVQGTGAAVTQWYTAAGLIDANNSLTSPSGFGVSVRSDGKVLAGAAYSYPCPPLNLATCTDQATIVSSSTPSLNAWHHVVFTRTKSSGALALYVDGANVGTAVGPIGSSLTAAARMNFGRLQTGANYFTGSMDDITIYTSVLSAATVSAHYQRR